eukprot:2511076-Prymnesium_polylepis.1
MVSLHSLCTRARPWPGLLHPSAVAGAAGAASEGGPAEREAGQGARRRDAAAGGVQHQANRVDARAAGARRARGQCGPAEPSGPPTRRAPSAALRR